MQKKRGSAVNTKVEDSFQNSAASKLRSVSKNEWGENFIMDRCGLPCIPSLKGRENVQFVSLQHNLIVRIDSLMHFRVLMVLNLYDNKIERLSGLDTLKSLRVLMLGKNRIKKIEGLEALLNLDILDLHGNQITAITNLSHLSTLRVLNLAVNSLKKIPSLEGLVSLEELNLKRNKICKIATEVCKAKKLERLYLSNNDLRRLDDLTPLTQLGNLKELTLEGNPITLNSNYVMYTVGSLPFLILLDQNVICPALRREAEIWSAHNIQPDFTKIKPVVTVQNKTNLPPPAPIALPTMPPLPPLSPLPPLPPMANGKMLSAMGGKHMAVVRPMKLSNGRGPELGLMNLAGDYRSHSIESEIGFPTGSGYGIGSGFLGTSGRDDRSSVREKTGKKSFRQIAFSAMVCNTARPSRRNDPNRPVFKFCVRPPTVDLSSEGESAVDKRRMYVSDVDNEDSTSSWTSESDSETGSLLSHAGNSNSHRKRNVPRLGEHHHHHHHHHHRGSCHQKSNQKLSASIGVNIKEQLRDLRIIVGEDEIHIDGLNIIRMLNHINWSSDEVDLIRSVVFNGLSLDHLASYFSTMRLIFPNLRYFAFRNVLTPTYNHINSLCNLESALWTNWIASLSIETDSSSNSSCPPPPSSPPPVGPSFINGHVPIGLEPDRDRDRKTDPWVTYAIYRFHLFGLHEVNGQPITPPLVQDSEDQYGVLDMLVTMLVPPNVINRQIEKLSLLEPHVLSLQGPPSINLDEEETWLRKRAIRNIHQPLKEAKHFRNRSYYLRDLTEYGMGCVVKLSILSQNWSAIFREIVERAYREIEDETVYKKNRLQFLKQRQHQQTQQQQQQLQQQQMQQPQQQSQQA